MARSDLKIVCRIKKTVPANSTLAADIVNLLAFKELNYIVNYYDASGPRSLGLNLKVQKADGDLRDQVYAKYGDQINMKVSAVINGGDCEIRFTNDEPEPLELTLIRTIL